MLDSGSMLRICFYKSCLFLLLFYCLYYSLDIYIDMHNMIVYTTTHYNICYFKNLNFV